MRTSSATFLLLLLAACGSDEDGGFPGENKSGAPVERIECARGDAALASDCVVERTGKPGGELLVIHHADGGFRKLRQRGRTVETVDGAASATVQTKGDQLDVRVAQDHYRLPIAR
jgi:hypothetical protein